MMWRSGGGGVWWGGGGVFFFNDTATTEIYTLSLHDALPILPTMVSTILLKLDVMNIVFLPYVPGCLYDSDKRIYAVVGGLYIIALMITQVMTHILILKKL